MTAPAINVRVEELTARVDDLEAGSGGGLATAGTGLEESPAGTVNLSAANVTKLAALSGTNTGDQTNIPGNAATATKLAASKNINGVAFDGSADVTVPAAAGTLTGATLAAGVTGSSLTSVGTIATGVWQGTAIADAKISSASTWNAKAASGANTDITSVLLNQTGLKIKDAGGTNSLNLKPNETNSADRVLNVKVNNADRTVDLSGNLTVPSAATVSGTNTGDQTAVSGNAGTATALATSRKIDGVAFDGTAAIETSWSPARKPASAHAYDDEFESTNLSGNWTQGGTPVATAIDIYAAFSTANEWRSSHNALRPSWYLMQPSSAASVNALHKPVTVPTDWFVWARLSFSHRNTGTITNNDHSIMIGLSATSGGAPDSNNYVGLWVMETDTNQKSIQWDKAVSGVLTQTSLNVTNAAMFSGQYVGIHKISNNYYFWMADESGTWFYLGTHSAAITPDRVFVSLANAASTTPGCMVMGIDFIRFSTTITWLA